MHHGARSPAARPVCRRPQRGGFARDRGAVADAVLRKESLMEELWANYRQLLELAGDEAVVCVQPACQRSACARAWRRAHGCSMPSADPRTPSHAEQYQLSGGEGSRGSWRADVTGVQAEVEAAQRELHPNTEGEEESVAWSSGSGRSGGGSDDEEQEEEETGASSRGGAAGHGARAGDGEGREARTPSTDCRPRPAVALRQISIRSFFSPTAATSQPP